MAQGGAYVTEMPKTKRYEAGVRLLQLVGTSAETIERLAAAAEVNAKSRKSSCIGFRNLLMVADELNAQSDRLIGQAASDAAISQGRAKRERSVP